MDPNGPATQHTEAELRTRFVGKRLPELSVPAAVLDLAIIKRNCKLMLDAVERQRIKFRAHVKTHKTTQLTKLQVGNDSKDVRLIVSTVAELEALLPLCQDYQHAGAKTNILYGLPVGPSLVPQLAAIAMQLGPGCVGFMIDNVAQLESAKAFRAMTGFPGCVFVKVDAGTHRAGLQPDSYAMTQLVQEVSEAEKAGDLDLLGFYAHHGLSYGSNSPDDAMQALRLELEVCHAAAQHFVRPSSKPLIVSVGASPTALSLQNLDNTAHTRDSTESIAIDLQKNLDLVRTKFELEIHAGVYPVFDLQQIAASSRHFPNAVDAHSQQALTILTEVVSSYGNRTSHPEALINAGALALAREPCKSYRGWGVVSSWNFPAASKYDQQSAADPEKRIIVARISQEHGILSWDRENDEEVTAPLPVSYGQKIRVWVNHACIAGAKFGWYIVVDSSREGSEDEVVDCWARWNAW